MFTAWFLLSAFLPTHLFVRNFKCFAIYFLVQFFVRSFSCTHDSLYTRFLADSLIRFRVLVFSYIICCLFSSIISYIFFFLVSFIVSVLVRLITCTVLNWFVNRWSSMKLKFCFLPRRKFINICTWDLIQIFFLSIFAIY